MRTGSPTPDRAPRRGPLRGRGPTVVPIEGIRRGRAEEELDGGQVGGEGGLPRQGAGGVGPGQLHHAEGVGRLAGEGVVLGQRREEPDAGRGVDRQQGAGLAAVEQADERRADRQLGPPGEGVGHQSEQAAAGHRRQAEQAQLGEGEAVLEPDRVGVAGQWRVGRDVGRHRVEGPPLPLQHELDLVPVAHVAVGEDVVVAGHRCSLPRPRSPLGGAAVRGRGGGSGGPRRGGRRAASRRRRRPPAGG